MLVLYNQESINVRCIACTPPNVPIPVSDVQNLHLLPVTYQHRSQNSMLQERDICNNDS